MALAPLSRTVVLTEDGSTVRPSEMVTIPPRPIVKPPPVVTTPADIVSDGTPQVGEQLTGVDPVATFATYGNRRWLRGETVLARTSAYTPNIAGDIDWLVDVIGTDGVTVLISRKRVTISAVPAPSPTIDNTLADSTLPISAIPGLLDRINALDARLVALGIAAADPDVADAIAAVLADLAAAIDAIDLHRTLAVVLPALEAAMTQLEEAAQNPNPQPSGQWHANSTDIFANGTDWFADGTKAGGAAVPDYAISSVTSPVEGTGPATQVPDYAISSVTSPAEGTSSTQLPDYAISSVTSPQEGTATAVPDYAIASITSPQEGN